MTGTKQIVIAVVLIVVIVAAVTFGIRKSRGPGIAPEAAARIIEKMDSKTGEPISRGLGEWISLRHPKMAVWKNPDTGDYTVVIPVTCRACGERVPGPLVSEDVIAQGPPAFSAARANYTCPKCGENVGLGTPAGPDGAGPGNATRPSRPVRRPDEWPPGTDPTPRGAPPPPTPR